MGLTDILLGELIEPCNEKNGNEIYGLDAVKGVSTGKVFIETKANMEDVSLKSYLLVKPRQFAFVPDTSRRGDKIALAFNNSNNTYLISAIYEVFQVKDTDRLIPEYLYMWLRRSEFDRYSRYNSWGSAREVFSYNDMCSISLKLPSHLIQQNVVDAYSGLSENLLAYTDGLEDLKMTCDIYMDNIKKEYPRDSVGNLLKEIDVRNRDSKITNVLGINIEKSFMPSVANLAETDITKYKVIGKGQFAYSPMQTGRDETIRVALFDQDEKVVISPAYSVLEVKNEKVLPEYLMVWFKRKESDRLGWFLSDGSVRASLEVNRFFEIEIPIPPKPIQQSIVDIYHAQYERKEVADKLNNTLREICPVLIKQSLAGA